MGTRHNFGLSLAFLIGSAVLGFTPAQASWQKLPLYIGESEITSLLSLSGPQPVTLIGTSSGVYRSQSNQDFSLVLSLEGRGRHVNYLYSNALNHPQPQNILTFAATDSGLFLSQNLGQDWEKIFESTPGSHHSCLSVILQGDTIFLGTESGLFYKKLSDKLWQEEKAFQRKIIPSLAADQEFVYVTTDNQVFRLDAIRHQVDEIFTLVGKEGEAPEDSTNEEAVDTLWVSQIKEIKVLSGPPVKIYVATVKGIFCSTDEGETWQNLNPDGLPLDEINSLVVLDEEHILVGTHKGVFRYDGKSGRWSAVYEGMETYDINFMTDTPNENIYALSQQGIFFMPHEKAFTDGDAGSEPFLSKSGAAMNYKRMAKRFSKEPSIRDVQAMAVDYAEVNPNKIMQWRKAAQKKAWMPKLSVGLNRSATELFHWDTGPNPDNLLKGREFMDWDVGLSWDLGELIWNPDQTSIDSRSKLMVELRDDILDQVTRLYFERRRLQMELTALSNNDPSKPDRQMRVEELTALIDGLTGGEFSRLMDDRNHTSGSEN